MTRFVLTLCCLGLLCGAIAVVLIGACETPGFSAENGRVWRSSGCNKLPGGDRHVDRQHSLPLLADADETDDAEELSGRAKGLATRLASPRDATGPSPHAARLEAAIQHRAANTLNGLGVRLQI
ncbi:MAG TPA: hypothetical protein VG826_25735 [Pirellulales bacterium]|nr:hypothetical protein [Pirellulales bacterium]